MNFRGSCTSKTRAKVGAETEVRQASTRKIIGERRGGFLCFEGLSMGGAVMPDFSLVCQSGKRKFRTMTAEGKDGFANSIIVYRSTCS